MGARHEDAEPGMYVRRCAFFGVSGRFPMPSIRRAEMRAADQARTAQGLLSLLKAGWGELPKPTQPPANMTPEQVARANVHLEKRNWRIVMGKRKVWGLVRIL